MTALLTIGNYFIIAIACTFCIIFLFVDSKINKARNFIVFTMIIIAIVAFSDFTIINNKYNSTKLITLFYLPLFFLLYPILYHYILNLTNNSKTIIIEKNKFILPLIILLFNLVIYSFYGNEVLNKFIIDDFLISLNDITLLDTIIVIAIFLYYLQAIYFLYKFYQFQSLENRNIPAYLKRWIKFIFIGIIVVELFYIVTTSISIYENEYDLYISILFVLFLGIVGVKHNEILLQMKITNSLKEHNLEEISKRKRPSNITHEEMNIILASIDRLITVEKLYLDPNLKLKNFARKLHIPEKELSILINDSFNKNFTTYINDFRIEEAKIILKLKGKGYKLDNLYAEVGFFTRSTFNRVFKSTTNSTPSEYQKSVLA